MFPEITSTENFEALLPAGLFSVSIIVFNLYAARLCDLVTIIGERNNQEENFLYRHSKLRVEMIRPTKHAVVIHLLVLFLAKDKL